MDVAFEVAGKAYRLAERQATILAENLRILAKSETLAIPQSAVFIGADGEWRSSVSQLADSIEETLIDGPRGPLQLRGAAADASHWVLRLMVGLESHGAAGLRNAFGVPVEARSAVVEAGPTAARAAPRHLTRSELLSLLLTLFVLAEATVIAGFEWTSTWYILAAGIAALLGVRVANTRATGWFAWSLASVIWWAVLLIPAAVLLVIAGLVVVAVV